MLLVLHALTLACFSYLTGLCAAMVVASSEDQRRLLKDLFQGYDKLMRPDEINVKTVVTFKMNLQVIIFVNDQHQVMKINGYFDLGWRDRRLKWDDHFYGGNLSILRLPPSKVWQPEIALVSTTDGRYGPIYLSNVLVSSTGDIQWVPPFIYKSSCDINPRYFPFDEQVCKMYFRSLIYTSEEVSLVLGQNILEIKDYRNQTSGTWDLIEAPIFTHKKIVGGVMRDYIECHLRLRRKSLFYVVTILLPCILISFLTGFVFLLPSKGRTNVCLSILFAIVVFILLMSNILPPANTLPLLSEFLFFTFIMNVLSAFFTVITININYRSQNTHIMPVWMRLVFLQTIPIFLCMRRPRKKVPKSKFRTRKGLTETYHRGSVYHNPQCTPPVVENQANEVMNSRINFAIKINRNAQLAHIDDDRTSPIMALRLTPPIPQKNKLAQKGPAPLIVSQRSIESIISREIQIFSELLSSVPGYQEALKAVAFIAANIESKSDRNETADDWRFMSQVIDRLLLWVFFIVTSAGSMGIILNSPFIFDSTPKMA